MSITIESRKSEVVRNIIRICNENTFHRCLCLCDMPDLDSKLKPLLDEFEYLCNIEKGDETHGY